jgi:hypothetical protein
MKTPREVLLDRHALAVEKLDSLRRQAVRAAGAECQAAPGRASQLATAIRRAPAICFRELIWPARRVWAGFAVVWLALLVVNLAQSDRTATAAGAQPAPADMLRAWEQQQQIVTELIGQAETPTADRPRRGAPRPRSQRENGWLIT